MSKDFFSNKPLKGMLDDYPGDMRTFRYIESKIRETAALFHFDEYDSPVLEPIGLYAAKSSDELVKQQSYAFTDRGKRDLILRPEMTPSLARMVSGYIKENPLPLRWYSIPKCYRYERPQKGRLREFRQLNMDIIGSDPKAGDPEMVMLIKDLMKRLNVPDEIWEIRWNNRALMQNVLEENGFLNHEIKTVFQIIDKYSKMETEAFRSFTRETLSETTEKNSGFSAEEKTSFILELLSTKNIQDLLSLLKTDHSSVKENINFFYNITKENGLDKHLSFRPGTVRGLDYYTGMVFEVFDTGGKLGRALFGGGRYDNLISLFSKDAVSGTGFGMGIYIMTVFLKEYGLLTENGNRQGIFLIPVDNKSLAAAFKVAEKLRKMKRPVEISSDIGKVSKQLKKADKRGFDVTAIIGDEEIKTGTVRLKNLTDQSEEEFQF